jgi:hypothetical protein
MPGLFRKRKSARLKPAGSTTFKPQGGWLPFYYTTGQLYHVDAALRAVYHMAISLPKQTIAGGGYPVINQFRVFQGKPYVAQAAITTQGIGIAVGQFAIPQLTDMNGEIGSDILNSEMYIQ